MGAVHAIAPDGREYDLPEENVEAALAEGWTLPSQGAPAEQAPAPAPNSAPSVRMVPMLAPDGREFEIPETNLQAAMDEGWEPQVGLGEKVRTGLEGLARGASFHVSDAVQTGGAGLGTALGNALADDVGPGAVPRVAGPGMDATPVAREGQVYDQRAAQESLQGIRTRQTASPILAAGSELAGAILPALASGGATAEASGLQAASRLLPAGQASVLAARVQAALAPEGAGMLARIGSLAAAGATETTLQSATRRVVDDLVEGDHELSAERMLGGLVGVIEDAGIGALTGGLVGSVVEGSQQASRLAKSLLAQRSAQQAAAAAEPTLTFDLSLAPADAVEAAGPSVSSQLPTVADNAGSPIVQAARGAAQDFGEHQQGAVRAIAGDMDGLLRDADAVRRGAGLAQKRALAQKVVNEDPEQLLGAFQAARGTLDEVELSAKSMIDEFGEAALQDRGGLATLKRLEKGAQDAARLMTHRLENGDVGEAYMVLDDFKRIAGEAQNTRNPLIQARARSLYERVRVMLEDENAWGELATKQKPVNAATTETIRRSKDDLVRRFFRTSGDKAADPFEQLTQSNSESIGALLNRLGDAEVEPAEKALRLYLRSLAVDAETRAVAWGTPELVESAKRVTGAVNRIEARINAVAFARRDAKAWSNVMEYAGSGTVGGALRGTAKLGKLVISPVTRLAKSAVKQQQAVQDAAVEARHVLMGARSPRALKSTISASQVLQSVNQARALQDERSPESATLRQFAHEVSQDDPFFAQALEQKARAKAAFIAEKAGPTVDTSDPWASRPAMMDRLRASKLERYVDAAEDPGSAMKRLANGLGTAEDIETLQAVHPRLYETFVKLVQEQMGRTKVPPTTRQRQRLARATGLSLAFEQQPGNALFLQEVANAPSEEPPQPQRGGKMNIDPDDHYGTRSDQVMEARG